jgi:hypothetical protein
MAENTYDKHMAAVRQRIRQTFADMVDNVSARHIWINLHIGDNVLIGATWGMNSRQQSLFESEPRAAVKKPESIDLEPSTLLQHLNEFDNHDAIFEVDPRTIGKGEIDALCGAGAIVFKVLSHPLGDFCCAGFYDAATALEFRLGEHGHILTPMTPD